MSEFQWQFDAPSGTFKQHTLSQNIREAAIAETKFMQFVDPEPGYGKNKGESVTITRISNIDEPTDGRLTEGNTVPEDEFSLSTVSITVSEWGRSVPFTSFAQDLSSFNLENKIQSKLRDQMSLTLDAAAATSFKDAKIKAIPDGVASLTYDTDGTASTTATVNLQTFHLESIRDYMFSTIHVPTMPGGDYICCASTKALRGIKRDPNWEKWHQYPGGMEADTYYLYTVCDTRKSFEFFDKDHNPIIVSGGWTHQTYKGMLQEAEDFETWQERIVWKHSRKLEDPRCAEVTNQMLRKYSIV